MNKSDIEKKAQEINKNGKAIELSLRNGYWAIDYEDCCYFQGLVTREAWEVLRGILLGMKIKEKQCLK